MACKNAIELEPRLKAYLKNRIYKKKNNMSCVSLESEYWITNEDKDTIRCYLKAKKGLSAESNINPNKSKKRNLDDDYNNNYAGPTGGVVVQMHHHHELPPLLPIMSRYHK